MIPKFRAWLIEEKRMVDVNSITLKKNNPYKDEYIISHAPVISENGLHIIEKLPYTFDKIHLMQWTGAKDKNDTDIYEGDLIEGPFIKGRYLNVTMATFAWHCDHCGGYDAKNWNVIGNIHATPELLGEVSK